MVSLQPCDVIFIKKKFKASIIDRVIESIVRWATGSEYFHVAYFIANNQVFEANSFRLSGLADMTNYAEFGIKRLLLPIDVRERILQRMISIGGARYGWLEVAAIFLRKKLGVPIYLDSPARYICSEVLIKAVHAETGVWITNQSSGDVSPSDLWNSPFLIEIGG